MPLPSFAGLELLDTPVLICDAAASLRFVNPACENLLALGSREMLRHSLLELFQPCPALRQALTTALLQGASYIEHDLELKPQHNDAVLHVALTITPVDADGSLALIELRPLDQQLKIANEERSLLQHQANRELIRNLAHEIKNPLGGIRGAAQLLEHELADRPELKEYTAVITEEALRLQALVDRLLAPHRSHSRAPINIHEVLERVRSIALAQHPQGLAVIRDYDTSLPLLSADKEQLIQVVLNIVNNAVQALRGQGRIVLRTRVARQITLARKRHQLALKLQIEDNGPGVPDDIRDHIFYPLVTGRAEGTGLGLTLAQAFVHQHGGSIEFESRPGQTCFTVLLPFAADAAS
ncbi:PAS domain-containing protein [Chromobacterium subtsugae]|uniref:Sensory histidine kinase/phosphatase NtrB n=1 Tax=Chromobacterium subtsugae TaxID=251747 RepID=A0ABS7FFB3_9NEIS|nr:MULTISPECIES: nitrogen regulation protein NR(II) [Chromobacterium]KUM02406.1 histidine kinase [Chromobacterium subtsugae]KZE86849.1 PAS domain-containing sensor histidine kinase [Chromobacterium sp. F49]MBW7566901.1 PAS domain-containing protein [Chromobacterium subtsugae]MBW8288205.1 PAS domain-containing protein [Chromobacterium subtsugae]OBU86610.1 histidine kinase [Chromobacterium subtsugae]